MGYSSPNMIWMVEVVAGHRDERGQLGTALRLPRGLASPPTSTVSPRARPATASSALAPFGLQARYVGGGIRHGTARRTGSAGRPRYPAPDQDPPGLLRRHPHNLHLDKPVPPPLGRGDRHPAYRNQITAGLATVMNHEHDSGRDAACSRSRPALPDAWRHGATASDPAQRRWGRGQRCCARQSSGRPLHSGQL